MKASVLTTALVFVPALLVAQQQTSAAAATVSASSATHASVSIPATYSADARAQIAASIQAARAKQLPERPIANRIEEGQAKGASEAQVVEAVQKTQARMEATHEAMVRAGRANPSADEVASGEQAIARGATAAQIEALVKGTAANASLVTALDGLLRVGTGGVDAAAGAKGNGAASVGKPPAGTAGVTGAVTGAVSGVLGVKKP
jgi:hypothetical protein